MTHEKRRDNNWFQIITKMSRKNIKRFEDQGQVKFNTYEEFKDEVKK